MLSLLAWLLLAMLKATGAFVATLLSLYLLFRLRKWSRSAFKGGRRLPGPPTLPFLGNVLEFARHRRNTMPLFQRWVDQFGHTYRFTVLGDRDIVLVNDPESIKHVLR